MESQKERKNVIEKYHFLHLYLHPSKSQCASLIGPSYEWCFKGHSLNNRAEMKNQDKSVI